MCRFVLYLGDSIPLDLLIVKPANSLIHQSFHAEMRQPLNGDGFGVAWYSPRFGHEPAVFRAVTPAWNNQNLNHLVRVTESECILAHVRSASPGMAVNEANCHPFVYGPFSFMHNGAVAGFHRFKRRLVARLSDESYHSVAGTTDSAHLFALFLDCWVANTQEDPLQRIADALRDTIETTVALLREHDITEATQLNIAVSDGKRAVVCRYATGDVTAAPTLYWHEGKRYECRDGVVYMVDPITDAGEPDAQTDTVIVASEPLSDDYGWQPVEPNCMVLIGEDRRVDLRRLTASDRPGPTQPNVLGQAVNNFYHIRGTPLSAIAAPVPETAEQGSTLPHYAPPRARADTETPGGTGHA